MVGLRELLYYSAAFIAIFSIIAGVVAYYRWRYLTTKGAENTTRAPLTTRERFFYIPSAVLMVFMFPGNLYVWYNMRQLRTLRKRNALLKIKYTFFAINLSFALLLALFLYVSGTISAITMNMEHLDKDGFYISEYSNSKIRYIDSFVARARLGGLSEEKIRQTLSALKDFEKYIFTYRIATGHTNQPYAGRYRDILSHMIQEHIASQQQVKMDKDTYNITDDDYTKITALLRYAPQSMFDTYDNTLYLNEQTVHRWGNAVIAALLGEDMHILSRQQLIRESFFLAFRYKPLKLFSFIVSFFITALLLNLLLEKSYFRIIENHQSGQRKNGKRGVVFVTVITMMFLSVAVTLNLGNFFDVTRKPVKADIIVSLGGSPERLLRALELYKQGYSKTAQLVFSGPPTFIPDRNTPLRHNKKTYLIERGVPEEQVIYAKNTDTTMQEIMYVKALMLKHHYKSVLFVADPPHARRIMLMAKYLAGYDNKGLSYFVVSSEVQWWDKEHYYTNADAVEFVWNELMKLPYNFLLYGILKK